jgi:hypothetical protein
MKLQNGTPQAMALLKKFEDSGNLIDVYSENWKLLNDLAIKFTDESFLNLDADKGNEYRGHLLILCLADAKYADIKEICSIYPPLAKVFERLNTPKFLIFNLITKQILCVGLGRKYRLFTIDAASNESVSIEGIQVSIGADTKNYSQNFLRLDYFGVVVNFLKGLSDLDDALSENEEHSNQRGIDRAMSKINHYFPACREVALYPNDPY